LKSLYFLYIYYHRLRYPSIVLLLELALSCLTMMKMRNNDRSLGGLFLLLLISAPLYCVCQNDMEQNPNNAAACLVPDFSGAPPACDSTEITGQCEYNPFRCTGYSTVIFYIYSCDCFFGEYMCAVASSVCPPPPAAESCPLNKPQEAQECDFTDGICRYNAQACPGEIDANEVKFDVCECMDGQFTCTSGREELNCAADRNCPRTTPSDGLVCDQEQDGLTCKYNPTGCINTIDPAVFSDECTCGMGQWECEAATALQDCPDISEPELNLDLCYPGDATVQIQGGNDDVPMENLNIGDMVLVADGTYEPIYSFGHKDPTTIAKFVELKTTDDASLYLSAQHMVWEVSQGAYVPASTVREDDVLLLFSGHNQKEQLVVASVRHGIRKKGMYAPFTPSGTIVVNRIVSSTYVAIPNLKPLVENSNSFLNYQWMAHTGEFPHRLVCYHMGLCNNESYDDKGINQIWCTLPLQLLEWMMESSLSYYLFLIVSPMILFTFWIMEQVLVYPLTTALFGIVALITTTTRVKVKTF